MFTNLSKKNKSKKSHTTSSVVHSKMPHCEGRIGNKGVATSFVTNTEPALKDLMACGCGGVVVMRFCNDVCMITKLLEGFETRF